MMRARRRMLWNGAVTASVVLNMDGRLCAVPVVSQTGINRQEDADIISQRQAWLPDALAGMSRNARRVDASVEEIVGQTLRRVARSMFGLRPVAHVHIMRLGDGDLAGVA